MYFPREFVIWDLSTGSHFYCSRKPRRGMAGTVEAQLFPPDKLPKIEEDQCRKLEEYFRSNRNATSIDLMILAEEVGLPEEVVTIWFRHRLAVWRRLQGLPANCGHVND
ncbi:homeodomain-only protein-like [Lineus longissimus]|uniref:homeodomain-only protein-like n=1 Tax=Lineus longissimus TaxID=88925 RepID=UPI002B4EFB5E